MSNVTRSDDSYIYLDYIVNHLPHFIFWKDKNFHFLGCNQQFAKTAGLTSTNDIVGKTDYDMPWHNQAEIFIADDNKILSSGMPKLNYEEEQLQRDGSIAVVLVSKVPIRNEKDDIIGILGIYTDITERKKAEKKLQLVKQEIEAFAAQAAQVAHDIRSPLASLSVIANMLKDIPENYRIILRDSVNRINDIANNLLTNYKNQHTSQNEDKLQSWLVASLLESIISEKKLQHQHIAMEAHISSAAYFIFAHFNAIEMKRVISNIVNNAAEAFENEDGKIIISLDVENNQVILKIIDNGCGISEEKLAMVFQEGVSFKQHGSGLGLSHAKKSIEAWSGKIKLESQEGHGTTITITLPVVSPPVWFGATIEVTPQSTIVILDDDDSIHGAWDERLANSEAKHLPVIHFKLPRDLWRWCLENGDKDIVVLSDYEIIGQQMTGLDVLEKIKLAEKSFLITSHYENRNILERCEKAHIKLLPKNLIMHVAILLK